MKWVYLLIAILTEVVATGALKASHSFTRLGPSLLTVAGYLVAFYCLSLTLREMPVGVAYAIWGDRRHGADHSRRNRDQRILQNRRKSLIW